MPVASAAFRTEPYSAISLVAALWIFVMGPIMSYVVRKDNC